MPTIHQSSPPSKNIMSTQPSNAGMIAIELILSKIVDGDNQALRDSLSRLPLAVIPSESSETLINWFLSRCFEHNRTEAACIIIEIFDSSRIQVDPLPALTQLFLNTNISREVLVFAIGCFPDKQPLDFYIDLVNMNGDMLALKAAALLDNIFPDMPSDNWLLLHQLTEACDDEDEYRNPMLRTFFETKLAEKSASVSKPDWIRDYPVVDILPVPDTIPSVRQAVDLLLEDLKQQNISVMSNTTNESIDVQHGNEVKEQLISQYAISTIIEKIAMLSHIKHIDIFDDIPIFREFGPVNTLYSVTDTALDPDHPCSKYGGCRMFTCTEFEQINTDGEEIDIMAIDEFHDHYESTIFEYTPYGQTEKVSEIITINTIGTPITQIDWFRKSCDICLKPISHKHHALRKPLLHGGWRGCYCSSCFKLTVTNPNEAIMVGRVLEQLDVIGIRDRP